MTDASVLEKWRAEHAKTEKNIWYNAIMYHAQYRAEQQGLTKLIKTPRRKSCQLCTKEFDEDSVPVPFANRLGMDRIDFCAPCMKETIGYEAGVPNCDREGMLSYLRRLADAIQRVPSQGFEEHVETFTTLSDEERVRLFKALKGKPRARAIKAAFGSWFNALCEAGILEGETQRLPRGTRCKANDGHLCLSLPEKTIDDLLFAHAIPHEKEPYYPDGRHRADFLVGNTLIEYFGLLCDPEYDKKRLIKRAIARDHNIEMIELEPKDVASINSLMKKLSSVLRRFNGASSAANSVCLEEGPIAISATSNAAPDH